MFLLKLGSELQNLVKICNALCKLQTAFPRSAFPDVLQNRYSLKNSQNSKESLPEPLFNKDAGLGLRFYYIEAPVQVFLGNL